MQNTQQLYLTAGIIPHHVDNQLIPQRSTDGYVNATAMCRAVAKQFFDYRRLGTTEAFLAELSGSTGIPVDLLIYTNTTGRNEERGTWVHPDIAINLGQWCSAKFAVAVAKWVREWIVGKAESQTIPYHLRRYMANLGAVPPLHFSILNEMIVGFIAPLESAGYTLPEHLLPDISEGLMFCKWLREEQGVNTKALPKYLHKFADGRIVRANAYPVELLPGFRRHFQGVWLPIRAVDYFAYKDPVAVPFIQRLLLPMNEAAHTRLVEDTKAYHSFADLKARLRAIPTKN